MFESFSILYSYFGSCTIWYSDFFINLIEIEIFRKVRHVHHQNRTRWPKSWTLVETTFEIDDRNKFLQLLTLVNYSKWVRTFETIQNLNVIRSQLYNIRWFWKYLIWIFGFKVWRMWILYICMSVSGKVYLKTSV